ncbi:MAG TPA: hypothetical protein VER96_18435 [Polyangiaceae bacterium]|nr:hypothetical protein [Polyangiaceae bacterium]
MGRSVGRGVGAIIGLGVVLAACSGTKSGGDAPDLTAGSGGARVSTLPGVGGFGVGGAGSSSCVPGTKRCDGQNVKTCDDTGGGTEIITQTCLPSQTCSNGMCAGSACVPKTSSCKDGAVWKCDDNGVSVFSEQCASGLFCRVDGDNATCSAQACTPNQAVCSDNVATTCRADGSGVNSGGVDCSKSGQACDSGQCRGIVCKNGERTCQHGDVYLCAHNGTDVSLLAGCHSDEVCDGSMGSCRKKLCDPGKAGCDGTRAQTCNEFGSGWAAGSTDCATDGKICVNGGCKKQTCAASRSFCQDGNVYNCDSTGTSSTLSQTCNAATEHCTTYSGGSYGYCKTNDCHAGDSVCDGNVIKVCNADGSLPASGTPCGDTQTCDNAQCKDRPCVPGNYFCKGADVYYCDFSSPFMYLSQSCGSDSACKAVGTSGASCAPLSCAPGSTACIGNKIGTCASNGQSLSAVTTDCTTTSTICTATQTCAKSATDTIGSAENIEVISGSNLVADVIDVDSTRKLTGLQTQFAFKGTRDLRWIVYELTGQSFVAKYDKVTAGVVGDGSFVVVPSGALSYTLSAGKRYALGVVISGGDVIDNIDTTPYVTDVSCGTVVGRVISYYPGSFDAFSVDPSYLTQMQVVTESP